MTLPPFRKYDKIFLLEYQHIIESKLNVKLRDYKSHHTEKGSKIKTIKTFDIGWRKYSEFGFREENVEYDPTDPSSESSITSLIPVFMNKSGFKKDSINGKLVLEAGCGNGMKVYGAAKLGAEVVGIDLNATDIAKKNCNDLNNVHFIEADIFNLPFSKATFDVIYSIGVLHHTPSAKDSFFKLVPLLCPNGVFSLRLYKKGNLIFEFIDNFLRVFTTRIPQNILWHICYVITFFGKVFHYNKKLYGFINSFVRIRASQEINYDWYSPRDATHHTKEEITQWFKNKGFEEISNDDPTDNPESHFVAYFPTFAKKSNGTIKKFWAYWFPPFSVRVSGIKKG